MKNNFFKLLIALSAIALFTSCNPTQDKPKYVTDTHGRRMVAKIESEVVPGTDNYDYIVEQMIETYTFTYGEDFKLNKVEMYSRDKAQNDEHDVERFTTLDFIFNNNLLTIRQTFTGHNLITDSIDDPFEYSEDYKLNEKGYVIEVENQYTMTYDPLDRLTAITDQNSGRQYDISWENGNIVSRGSDSFIYHDALGENLSNMDWGAFYYHDSDIFDDLYLDNWCVGFLSQFGYFGTINKGFISETESFTYEYTFDSDGFVSSVKQYKEGKLLCTYKISYLTED